MSTGLSANPLGPEWEPIGPAPARSVQQPSNPLGPEWEVVAPSNELAAARLQQQAKELSLAEGVGRGLKRGTAGIQGGIAGAMRGTKEAAENLDRWAADLMGLDYERDVMAGNLQLERRRDDIETSKRIGQKAQEKIRNLPSSPSTEGFQPQNWRWWTEGISDFVPQLALQAGLAAGTGGGSAVAQVAVFAGTGGTLEAGNAYQEARERGASVNTATTEALLIGSISSALETIPGSVLLRKNPAAKSVFDASLKKAIANQTKHIVGGYVSEGGTEAAQEAWGDTVQWMMENDPKAFNEGLTRYGRSFVLGGAAGGGLAAAGAAGDVASEVSGKRAKLQEKLDERTARTQSRAAQTQELEELATPEGAKAWADANPDEAGRVAAGDTLSRSEWESLGFPGRSSAATRKAFVDAVKVSQPVPVQKEIPDAQQEQIPTPTDAGGGARVEAEVPQGPEPGSGEGIREGGQAGRQVPAVEVAPAQPEVQVGEAATEAIQPQEQQESEWAKATRQKLGAVPAFKEAAVELDETGRTARVQRPDGRATTIHFDADDQLAAIAKKRGRNVESVHGAYIFKRGKKGRLTEGDIYLRSDAGHRTVNHEVIHWLEDEGVITPEEVGKHGGREGIAVKYAEWAAKPKPDTLFQKIYDFLEPVFSSQRRFFESVGERGTAPKPKWQTQPPADTVEPPVAEKSKGEKPPRTPQEATEPQQAPEAAPAQETRQAEAGEATLATEPELAPDTKQIQRSKGEAKAAREAAQARKTPEGYAALPQKSQDAFNSAFEQRDVAKMQELSHPSNKALRAEFERRSGVKLPRGVKASEEAVGNFFSESESPAPSQPPSGEQVGTSAATDTAVPDPASGEAQGEADSSRPEVEASGFFGGGTVVKERVRDDQIPAVVKAPQEEVERRLQAARGLRKPSLLSRIKDTLNLAKNVTRAQEHLPTDEKFASANEFFRLLKTVSPAAKDEAIRTTAAIVDPLGPNQLLLFERAAIVENQLAALQMGQPLRFGFQSEAEVSEYRDQLQDAISKTPAVAEAIETRKKIVQEKVEQLVELDLLPESALENTGAYFHQQVHFYMQAHRSGVGTPGKSRRTFQGKRVEGETFDEKYDYNTSYLEAEISWLTDADIEIRKEKLLRKLVGQYDAKDKMVKAARETNLLAVDEATRGEIAGLPEAEVDARLKEELGDRFKTWRDAVRYSDEFALWQPEPGNHFYRAFSIPERIVEQIQREALAEITAEDIGSMLAIGQPHRQFVLPVELVAQLQATTKAELPHGLARIADEAMRAWKVWTLLSPKRMLGYNLRNITGDLDPVVAAVPGVLNYTGQAYQELQKYHGSFLGLSPNLRAARDLGVVGSGFAAEEVPDIADLPVFERFFRANGKATSGLKQLPKAYFDKVKQFTEFRENLLRYASYLAYANQLKAGKVTHYGGANKAVVDRLNQDMGQQVAAAHLSRQLIGDYGNISVAGNWIRRRMMPFWSFQEINLRRTPQLVVNAWEAGGAGQAAKAMGKAVARTILTSRIAWMFGALWVWNHLIQGGDEEDELDPYDRANPHVVLGRNPDGSIRVFRNVGAIGDFLEWFGLNEAFALLPKVESGQMTLGELAGEMAAAPVEKVFGSLRPEVGVATEAAMGISLFPEPFSPRSVRRDEAIPSSVGLIDEYKLAKGLILQDGSRPREHYWQRWMLSVSDPRKNALSEMYDARNRFLKKKGQQEKGVFPVSEYKEARDAAQNEDYDAFQEWKVKFADKHGDGARDKFKGFIERVDPIASRLSDKDEVEFERKFLTSEQREKLQVARQYSAELRDTLLSWWDVTEQSSLKEDVAASLAYSIARTVRPGDTQKAEIAKKVAELRELGLDNSRIDVLLNNKLRKQGVGSDGRQRWRRDLSRRLSAE